MSTNTIETEVTEVETAEVETPEVAEAPKDTQDRTEEFTPYGAAQKVNQWLEGLGANKTIPAQMMYNYTTAKKRAGKEPVIPLTEDNKIRFEDLEAWFVRYTTKLNLR